MAFSWKPTTGLSLLEKDGTVNRFWLLFLRHVPPARIGGWLWKNVSHRGNIPQLVATVQELLNLGAWKIHDKCMDRVCEHIYRVSHGHRIGSPVPISRSIDVRGDTCFRRVETWRFEGSWSSSQISAAAEGVRCAGETESKESGVRRAGETESKEMSDMMSFGSRAMELRRSMFSGIDEEPHHLGAFWNRRDSSPLADDPSACSAMEAHELTPRADDAHAFSAMETRSSTPQSPGHGSGGADDGRNFGGEGACFKCSDPAFVRGEKCPLCGNTYTPDW